MKYLAKLRKNPVSFLKVLAIMFLASAGAFIASPTAALGLIAGILAVVVGGTMAIVGAYVVFTVNDAIGHGEADISSIYTKVMKAFLILGVAMIVVGAAVILRALMDLG